MVLPQPYCMLECMFEVGGAQTQKGGVSAHDWSETSVGLKAEANVGLSVELF